MAMSRKEIAFVSLVKRSNITEKKRNSRVLVASGIRMSIATDSKGVVPRKTSSGSSPSPSASNYLRMKCTHGPWWHYSRPSVAIVDAPHPVLQARLFRESGERVVVRDFEHSRQ